MAECKHYVPQVLCDCGHYVRRHTQCLLNGGSHPPQPVDTHCCHIGRPDFSYSCDARCHYTKCWRFLRTRVKALETAGDELGRRLCEVTGIAGRREKAMAFSAGWVDETRRRLAAWNAAKKGSE